MRPARCLERWFLTGWRREGKEDQDRNWEELQSGEAGRGWTRPGLSADSGGVHSMIAVSYQSIILTIVIYSEELQLMVSSLLLHEYCLLESILCLGASINIDLRIDD